MRTDCHDNGKAVLMAHFIMQNQSLKTDISFWKCKLVYFDVSM